MEPYNPENMATAFAPAAPQTSSATGLRQYLSKDQWEVLRPLIQRLYIEENRTFPYIADCLAKSHSFRPTKKQFTTKTNEWGFKKYFKKTERREILQHLGQVEDKVVVNTLGWRHNRLKLERWQNELKKESVYEAPMASITDHIAVVTANVCSEASSDSIVAMIPTESYSSVAVEVDNDIPMVEVERERKIWVQSDEEYHYYPYAEWANVDAQGSPNLTRLFQKLSVETNGLPDGIEELVLPDAVIDLETLVSRDFISGSELTSLCHKEHSSSNTWNDYGTAVSPVAAVFPSSDAWLPSGAQIEAYTSPFNELYPFLTSIPRASERFQSSRKVLRPLKTDEEVYTVRLELLRRAGFEESPVAAEVMRCLALVYFNQGKLRQAEALFRKIISVRKEPDGHVPVSILQAQIDLINSICDQGKTSEASGMLENLYTAMAERFAPDHFIYRGYLLARLRVSEWSQNFGEEEEEEGEAICRDLVQICLVYLGPRDEDTQGAILRLGDVKRHRGQYVESERLERVALQLSHEIHEKSPQYTSSIFDGLGHSFECQSQLEDAVKCYRVCYKIAKDWLGDEHIATMRYNRTLGRVLRKQGLLQDSKTLLMTVLRLQNKVLGEDNPNTLQTMMELRITEAAIRMTEAENDIQERAGYVIR